MHSNMRRRFFISCKKNNLDRIYYTSVDNSIVVPYNSDFGASIITNTVVQGTGIIIFDSDVSYIGRSAFYRSALTSITIPNSVTSIGYLAFNECISLTSVTIPDSVTSIGECGFYSCSSLTSVTIGNGVTSIEYAAFYGCQSLTSITIPNSVTSIGDLAFYGCSKLTSLYCKATIPPTLDRYVFSGDSSDRIIYVPTESVEAYKAAANWSTYADSIVGYDFEDVNVGVR